jgi:hypothetical protein
MDYVKGSFAVLHRAVATISDANMLEPAVNSADSQQRNRLHLAVDAVAHWYNHYGQMVEYLRMNGRTSSQSPITAAVWFSANWCEQTALASGWSARTILP